MYEVILEPPAQQFYERAQKPLAKKLNRCFSNLEADPRQHNNVTTLKGSLAGKYRFRVGDHRVIYTIDERQKRVHVLEIGDRKDIYD